MFFVLIITIVLSDCKHVFQWDWKLNFRKFNLKLGIEAEIRRQAGFKPFISDDRTANQALSTWSILIFLYKPPGLSRYFFAITYVRLWDGNTVLTSHKIHKNVIIVMLACIYLFLSTVSRIFSLLTTWTPACETSPNLWSGAPFFERRSAEARWRKKFVFSPLPPT